MPSACTARSGRRGDEGDDAARAAFMQLLQTAQQGNEDFFYILIVIVRGYRVSIDNGMILQVVSLRECV